ncbi:hypothetical protein BH11PSE2_BH11PSE2_05680 [soil metagenome]
MATVIYPAFAVGDRTSGYTAHFPDLADCTAQAATLADLLTRAREALQHRLSQMAADGVEWPEPSNIEDLATASEGKPAGTLLVDVDIEDAPVRVNISIGERLLKRIDQSAEARGMTRSGFIAAAARGMLDETFASARAMEWDSRKVQETLAEYGRVLHEKFGPESEFARGFNDLDRKITRSAEAWAQQFAAAMRGHNDDNGAGGTGGAGGAGPKRP